MIRPYGKMISLIIFVSFVATVSFGFALMMHEQGEMVGACPFSPAGVMPCSESMMTSVIHHISAYYSFLNVPAGMTVFSTLFLIGIFLVSIFSIDYFTLPPVSLSAGYVDFSQTSSSKRKTIRWLSLFEHSPSLA